MRLAGKWREQIVAAYDDAKRRVSWLGARMSSRTSSRTSMQALRRCLMEESYVPQGSELLYTTQHRLREKRAIEAAGVKVAPYARSQRADDARKR